MIITLSYIKGCELGNGTIALFTSDIIES